MWLVVLQSLIFHSVSLKASLSSSIVLLLHPCLSSSYCHRPLRFASGISFDISFVLTPPPNHLSLFLRSFYPHGFCLVFMGVLPCLWADDDKAVGKSWLVK